MKKISVIIPAYNEEQHIAFLLQDLAQQDLNTDVFEVIVVDNASTDDTVAVVAECMQTMPRLSIVLVREDMPGVSAARNRGALHALGEVLVHLDADNTIDMGLLSEVYRKFYVEGYKAGTIRTLAKGSYAGEVIFFILEKIKTIVGRPFGKSFCSKELHMSVKGFNTHIGMAGTNLDFLCRIKNELSKKGERLGHITVPVYASLRRFEVNGYASVLFKWFQAYIGFGRVSYERK